MIKPETLTTDTNKPILSSPLRPQDSITHSQNVVENAEDRKSQKYQEQIM